MSDEFSTDYYKMIVDLHQCIYNQFMDSKRLKRQRERNQKAPQMWEKKNEQLCLQKQEIFNRKNPQLDPRALSENIRIIINRYLDTQSEYIIDYLIRILAELSEDEQYVHRCQQFTSLKKGSDFNAQKQDVSIIRQLMSEQLNDSSLTLSQNIQQNLNNIEKIDNEIKQTNEEIAKTQQIILNNKAFLSKNSDAFQTKQQLEKQLRQLKQQSKLYPRDQIRKEFEIIEDEYDKVYGEIEQIPEKEAEQEKKLRQLKDEEKKKKEEKITLKRKRAKLESQIKRLQLMIEKKKNLLNIGLSEISDIYPHSRIDDRSIMPEPEPQQNLPQDLNNKKTQQSKRIYHYEKPPKNTFCELLLIIFAIILVITFFMKKNHPEIPSEI